MIAQEVSHGLQARFEERFSERSERVYRLSA
jgi:hypothetical protein